MKNRTKFHRIRKKRNFTILDNHFIQREDLSWKAKGIMAYIFSLPDDRNSNEEYFINKVQSATGIPTYIADKQ